MWLCLKVLGNVLSPVIFLKKKIVTLFFSLVYLTCSVRDVYNKNERGYSLEFDGVHWLDILPFMDCILSISLTVVLFSLTLTRYSKFCYGTWPS